MEYEYVCQRSKDIAYGELLCIMQLFVSSTFIQTHTHTRVCASTHQDSIPSHAQRNRTINPSHSALSVSTQSHVNTFEIACCVLIHNGEQISNVASHVALKLTARRNTLGQNNCRSAEVRGSTAQTVTARWGGGGRP